MKRAIFFAALLALLVAVPMGLRAEQFLGEFGDWSAYTNGKGEKKSCYIASLPKKTEGKYKKRGETYILLTHWPALKDFNVIELRAGYTYKKDSEVRLNIDTNAFSLFVAGGTAWARDKKTDRLLARAMIKGVRLVALGTSSKGTRTRDTYSLSGFTAAYKAIGKACGVP